MTRQLPPDLQAAVDRHLAGLRDLVQLARDHRDAHDCPLQACPGPWVWEVLDVMDHRTTTNVLALALSELARVGYGLPTDVLPDLEDGGRADV